MSYLFENCRVILLFMYPYMHVAYIPRILHIKIAEIVQVVIIRRPMTPDTTPIIVFCTWQPCAFPIRRYMTRSHTRGRGHHKRI